MGDLSSARCASPEELAAVRESYRERFSRPEAQGELEQVGAEIQRSLGLTGNFQYDDIARGAEAIGWYAGIKDQQFTI